MNKSSDWRRRTTVLIALLATLLVSTLSACGQTGPLTLRAAESAVDGPDSAADASDRETEEDDETE